MSKQFNSEIFSQRIKVDFIEDEIKKTSLNVERANNEMKDLNKQTKFYQGIYFKICLFTFLIFVFGSFFIYYFYYK